MAELIPNFEKIDVLRLDNYSWSARDETHWKNVFQNITKLTLKNPRQVVVDKELILKIGTWCQNLKSFSLTLYQPDIFTRVHIMHGSVKAEFFPKLEGLALDGDVSMPLIESLLVSVSHLKRLTIYIHDLGLPNCKKIDFISMLF